MTQPIHVVCAGCNGVNRVPDDRLGDDPHCAKCKRPLFTGQPIPLGAASFDRQLSRNDLPLVVDFWAPWCGPCHAMAPAFEQAARQLEPHVRLAKVDTESEPAIAARYGIRSIPTLIAFRGGREIARQSGAVPLNTLLGWISASFR